jgi:hypothetical protein
MATGLIACHCCPRLLVVQVRDLAVGVGLAIRTARRLNVPVEPGVPEGRDALVRRAVLLELVIPQPAISR